MEYTCGGRILPFRVGKLTSFKEVNDINYTILSSYKILNYNNSMILEVNGVIILVMLRGLKSWEMVINGQNLMNK